MRLVTLRNALMGYNSPADTLVIIKEVGRVRMQKNRHRALLGSDDIIPEDDGAALQEGEVILSAPGGFADQYANFCVPDWECFKVCK